MERAAAIDHLRRALGKGPDVALAATAHIMEYGVGRYCTYAELTAACGRARARPKPASAWVAARDQGDAALRELVTYVNPLYAAQARFGTAPAAVPVGPQQEPTEVLAAFLPFQLPARWRWVGVGPDSTLEYWLTAVDKGFQGRYPWAPLVRWFLDTQPPRIHERRATVSTPAGRVAMTRRPRLASQATTGRWSASVHAGEIDGVLVAARTQVPLNDLHVFRPVPPPDQLRLFHLPLPARDERLTMLAAYDRQNTVLRGDTSLLLDVAHMADFPVRGKVREWAALLARTRDGGFRWPQVCDFRRVWDAALALRCMHVRERDAAGKLTGRWAPLAHVDADWGASQPADPDRDELIIGPSQWLRTAMRSTGGWTLTATGGERGRNRVTVGEQSVAGLLVTALEYYLAGYYDGAGRVGRHLVPDRKGHAGPVVQVPWQVVMYLAGDPWEFSSHRQERAAYARFRRAMDRLRGRGYFVPGALLGGSAPAGDSVEILACAGRPARVWVRASDWFCAAAQQVAAKPDGFAQVPLGTYLGRSEWRVAGDLDAPHAPGGITAR